ncbi:hypothetical protein APHAL10511_000359 [Amanita phalloides]|nr:hypothetical protein APHAL10511_000359 [Amanita phalloides]
MERLHDVQLDPPVGTCYFKSYTYNLKGEWAPVPSLPGTLKSNMDVTFYIYVTLAKPADPDFTVKGGKVYIVAEYNGSGSILGLDFGVEDLSGVLSAKDQLPVPGSEVKNEDTRVYTIEFARGMSMFNNGGNSGFTFPARYKRVFSLTGQIQSKYQITSWSVKHDYSAKTPTEPVLNGLQIFETDKLTKAKIKLFFILRFPALTLSQAFSKEIELDFSAETMAKAVVG